MVFYINSSFGWYTYFCVEIVEAQDKGRGEGSHRQNECADMEHQRVVEVMEGGRLEISLYNLLH